MKTRLIRISLAGGILALSVVACGGKGSEKSDVSAREAPAQAAGATRAPDAAGPLVLLSMNPVSTKAGQSFRPQPDDTSALGMRASGTTRRTRAFFDDQELVTFVGPEFVSANVPNRLLKSPGTHKVSLREGDRVSQSLDFTVSP